MKRLAVTFAALLAVLLILWWVAPSREIVTRISIARKPPLVWAVLIDGPAYPEWSLFIRRLDGLIAVGQPVTVMLKQRNGDPMTFSPVVAIVAAPRELRWRGRLLVPGLFDGEHYFLLSATPDGGTVLTHGERFSGILPWLIGVERFRDDFKAFNTALAARVEALASARGGHPNKEST